MSITDPAPGRYAKCECGAENYCWFDVKNHRCHACGRTFILHRIGGHWYADTIRERGEPVNMRQAIRTGMARKKARTA